MKTIQIKDLAAILIIHRVFTTEEINIIRFKERLETTYLPTNISLREKTIRETQLDLGIWLIMINGITFWIEKISHISAYFNSPSILRTQEWNGGSPNLNKIVSWMRNLTLLSSCLISKAEIKTNEASLWEIKYFTPVILFTLSEPLTNTGTTESILTSKQIHWATRHSKLKENITHAKTKLIYPQRGLKNIIGV